MPTMVKPPLASLFLPKLRRGINMKCQCGKGDGMKNAPILSMKNVEEVDEPTRDTKKKEEEKRKRQ